MAKRGFNGEIIHFNPVRLRVTGQGDLRMYLRSLDDINSTQIPTIIMAPTTNREPVSISNFRDQRGQLEVRTIQMNETFNISKIVIFVKATATGYPQ